MEKQIRVCFTGGVAHPGLLYSKGGNYLELTGNQLMQEGEKGQSTGVKRKNSSASVARPNERLRWHNLWLKVPGKTMCHSASKSVF